MKDKHLIVYYPNSRLDESKHCVLQTSSDGQLTNMCRCDLSAYAPEILYTWLKYRYPADSDMIVIFFVISHLA